MSDFNVTILGCGSARPSLRHHPSSQVVQYGRNVFMIDCGEGSQMQMQRYKLPVGRLRHIFISHLHGDHFFGLPGLLSTLSLRDGESTVHVYCFAEGIDLLRRTLSLTSHNSGANIAYHALTPGAKETLYEDDALTIESFPLYHYTPAAGFIFREKPRSRRLIGDMLEYHQVPLYRRAAIKAGEDYVRDDGTVVPNDVLSMPPAEPRSYAYCSDTMRDTRVADAVRGVRTLYHEATYGDDKAALARERGHSTSRQAAEIAKMAGAGRLVIGHYSQSYHDITPLLVQAWETFPNTLGADEGMVIDL